MLAGLLVGVAPGTAAAADPVHFTDAERTVACQIVEADEYTPYDGLRCDVLGPPVPAPLPPKPSDCPAEWAAVVTMDQNEVRLPQWGACVGDSIAYGPALEAGEAVEAGAFRCVVLSEGVRCRNTGTRYGFVLSHDKLKRLRPAAKAKLSPAGLGKLRLNMSVKRAKKTGWLTKPICGSPQLKQKVRMRVWLNWRKGRLHSVLANSYTNVETRKRVGIGSSLAQVKRRYRGKVVKSTDLVFDRTAYAYVVRHKAGRLVFFLQTSEGQSPSSTTPVDALWAVKKWNPKKGFGFSGC